ncbi:ABC transporter ATP-binding protein [Halogeometricum borinquense]|uniref:Molybdate/tungstate import ATP-binding protein WtpC n=1 Tax=Halogeometricum borinquense TaxID=60847 RepID=A0A6C0ULD1_9EURY|nr:ABC transporter ATP-binding protein [Halogeometricum borinquense]QIB76067.1 ABC transporter ATP-binding protein [Halogeometricum borinquense]
MLTATNLRKEYGSLVAVNDVDLEIETGEFATIVGPSGCGKTTLLRMLAGHLEPTAGEINLDGQDITYTSPQKRPTSLVFQSWALFPHMTVRENIEFPIKNTGREVNGQVEELLEQVRLDPEVHADKQATELSGGQKQRVALARSLAYDPDILLLDEPLASLDYVLQKRLQRELADLNVELDMTFIYVTHSLEAALVMSDKLFVLDDGDTVQTGPPEDIYREPNNKFIAEFMGDANVFPVAAETVSGGTADIASAALENSGPVETHLDIPPEYLVVRYDDCIVEPDLRKDFGAEVHVDNILVRGNTVLIEGSADHSDQDYVAEVDFEKFEGVDLAVGDTAYLQWDARKSILVPE